jgi:hypothetical protein
VIQVRCAVRRSPRGSVNGYLVCGRNRGFLLRVFTLTRPVAILVRRIADVRIVLGVRWESAVWWAQVSDALLLAECKGDSADVDVTTADNVRLV